jgi:hypothetical protein
MNHGGWAAPAVEWPTYTVSSEVPDTRSFEADTRRSWSSWALTSLLAMSPATSSYANAGADRKAAIPARRSSAANDFFM